MTTKVSRRLVVDASIARAAGGHGSAESSRNCRNFLLAVRRLPHRIVQTQEVLDEWIRHESNFTRRWRVAMEIRRGKILTVELNPDAALRAQIDALNVSDEEKAAMLKDCRLIEAAMMTDRIIVSLDETARRLFTAAAKGIQSLGRIVWINPDRPSDKVQGWLEGGAKPDDWRRLGNW